MAVEFVLGRAGSGKSFYCYDKVKNILRDSPLKTEVIFLLPAYQTYRAELEFAEMTGGALNVRMFSFQRFARHILSEVGGSIVPRISEIGRRLILRKILIDRADKNELKYYFRAAKQRGFAEVLANEIKELRTYAIDSVELRENISANEKIDDELKNKIHDLTILAEDFRGAIKDKLNDESDLLELAAQSIKNFRSIENAEVFADGFIFFDPRQCEILRELFMHAKNVHVVLPTDTNFNSPENLREVGLFHRPFETFQTLRNLAEEAGAKISVTKLDAPKRFSNPALKYIEQNFFKLSPKKFSSPFENLKVVEAVNKRAEVEAVARDILKIHREKKIRLREIGIIARSEDYKDLFKPIFEMHGIPFFIDDKRPAVHHPLAELIRSALETFRGWKSESIFRCLRTGFFSASPEEIDILENHVLEFGLRGENVWKQSEMWHWHRYNLDEPENEIQDNELERITRIDELRRRAVAPLVRFSEKISRVTKKSKRNENSGNVRELTSALFDFLTDLKIHDQLSEMSEEEEKRGNLSLSKEHLKIWDDVVTLAEQIVESLKENKIDLREFELIVNEGLDALQMSLIPPGIDEVTISKFDQNSLQNSSAIYIVGADDKNFPGAAKEEGLLTDADRLHLKDDAGVKFLLGGRESLLGEKFLEYRGLTLAKKYLHVSYPLANAEGEGLRPSVVIEKLTNIFPGVKVGETVSLDVLKSLGSEIEFLPDGKNLLPDSAKQLFAPKNFMGGSVTRFESFNECHFQYFAKYGLRLGQRPLYEVNPPDVGNILHAVMKKFGEDLQKENRRWATVAEPELTNRVTKIFDEVAGNLNNKIFLKSNFYKRRRERIKKVAVTSLQRLIELDKVSKFHPEIFEAGFEDLNDKALVYKIDGTEMKFTGKIDRTDFSEDGKHFIVIDYKTGTAHVSLKKIFIGLNLQLLTYLTVAGKLEKFAGKLPAGMLYFFLKYPTINSDDLETAEKEIAKELKPDGWLLDDAKVIRDFDGSKDGEFLRVKLTENSVDSRCKGKVKSDEEFKILTAYVEMILRQTGEKILRGDIAARPVKTGKKISCDTCDYREVCGFNPKTTEPVNLPKMKDAEIINEMKLQLDKKSLE